MATRVRARDILERSRILLDRSRVVTADLLDPTRKHVPKAIEAGPSAAVSEPDSSLGDVCSSIAMRDLNLIDSLLSDLEDLEQGEQDDDRLGQLYRIDHLAARLRRNAENLRVLAGRDADEVGGDTTSVLDTIRGAMSSIDQYYKIEIGHMVALGVVGYAATDLSRVLAELLDNAANHSPPGGGVRASSHLTERGSVLVRIEDDGIGLPEDRLVELNDRLSRSRQLDDDTVRHMGLSVVRSLTERHGMAVYLDHRVPNGTTASVVVPASLVTELADAGWSAPQPAESDGRHHLRTSREPVAAPPVVPVPAPEPGAQEPSAVRVAPYANGLGPVPSEPLPDLPRRGQPSPYPAAEPSAPFGEPPMPREAGDPPMARPSPTPRTPSSSPAIGGMTESGLPRRVSRSIKPDDVPGSMNPAMDFEAADTAGQDQFLADLDGFTDGEMAAHAGEPGPGTEDRA